MMSIKQKNRSSGVKLSFPIMEEFEFGSCVTPDSPTSPADHLFFNGRLLPHAFPSSYNNCIAYSRSTSRTSSVSSSSKDSLMSSRSNSTNSRNSSSSSSGCSSARSSTSEATSERKLVFNHQVKNISRNAPKRPVLNHHQYSSSSSQRWQFITAFPVLKRQVSCSRKTKPKKQLKDGSNRSRAWFGQKIFMSIWSAFIECHAIKPPSSSAFECD